MVLRVSSTCTDGLPSRAAGDELGREGGHARQVTEEVQGGALRGEDGPQRARHLHHRVARLELGAVLRVPAHAQVRPDAAERLGGAVATGQHPGLRAGAGRTALWPSRARAQPSGRRRPRGPRPARARPPRPLRRETTPDRRRRGAKRPVHRSWRRRGPRRAPGGGATTGPCRDTRSGRARRGSPCAARPRPGARRRAGAGWPARPPRWTGGRDRPVRLRPPRRRCGRRRATTRCAPRPRRGSWRARSSSRNLVTSGSPRPSLRPAARGRRAGNGVHAMPSVGGAPRTARSTPLGSGPNTPASIRSARRAPKTMPSRRELDARRLAPCTPVQATSPTAERPASAVAPTDR